MKRFYTDATAAEVAGGWQVMLDTRGVKTQGGRAQVVPHQAMAEALAAEWAAQGPEIAPARFILRDMADYAIDIIMPDRDAARAALLRFAETDTLCYRAEAGEALTQRQQAVWEPLLQAAEARYDVHFERISGVIHRPQPPATLARMAVVLAAQPDFTLAALNTLASLAASLVIGLAAITPVADAASLWNAAELELDWQAEQWGKDAEAEALRARRFGVFAAAVRFAGLVHQSKGISR